MDERTLGLLDELQRQNRGVAAGGVLAGLGAIIRLIVADRRAGAPGE